MNRPCSVCQSPVTVEPSKIDNKKYAFCSCCGREEMRWLGVGGSFCSEELLPILAACDGGF